MLFFQQLDKDSTVYVMSTLWALSASLTTHHGPLGKQIASTVGDSPPGTTELMKYHLLHVKSMMLG